MSNELTEDDWEAARLAGWNIDDGPPPYHHTLPPPDDFTLGNNGIAPTNAERIK